MNAPPTNNRKVYMRAVAVVVVFVLCGAGDCALFHFLPRAAVFVTMGACLAVGILAGVGYWLLYGEHGK